MLGFLRRTLLYQRASEVWGAYRALKRSEHRSALKLKRAVVRSRIFHELQRAQIEHAILKMEGAKAALRVQTAQSIAAAHDRRNKMIRQALEARGEPAKDLESSSSTSPATVSSVEPQNTAGADAFKEQMLSKVESLLPPTEETGPGRRIASELFRNSVKSVPLADERGQAEMSVRLIAGVAKQTGVRWEEMERLVDVVEKDQEKREELRRALKEAMFKEEQRVQNGT